MKIREIDLEDECTKEEFDRKLAKIFPGRKYIYAMIPVFYGEFIDELSTDFTPITMVSNPYSGGQTLDIVGVTEDHELKYAFEFYERAALIAVVITSAKVELDPYNIHRDTFYKFFEEHQIPHVTIGPDGQWLEYHYNDTRGFN